VIWKDAAVLDEVNEIVERLLREEERKPALASTLALHRELIIARAQLKPPEIQTRLGKEGAKELLRRGVPLLQGEKLKMEGLLEFCQHICQITARHRPDLADQLDEIRGFLLSPALNTTAEEYLQGKGRVEGNGSSELLTFVLNNALHPFLKHYAQAVEGLVDESTWYRGYCPICGGEPDLAYLSPENGARRLLCSRCDTEWDFWRLGCPFCENKERESLGYYPSEDNLYRLYVCEECCRYLKSIDLRGMSKKPPLPLERILTLEMDLAARQMGYR